TTISGVSINFYGANLRASNTGVSVNDALAMTTNYSKDFDLSTVSTITGPDSIIANRTSKTFFVGGKGDEIADYSVNYKKGTTTISGVSINFYGANLRASNTGVSVNDALAMTTNYSKDFDLASVSTITGPDSIIANRTSKTFFVGGKGDEIADYSVNYKKGTTTISGVSINFYGANLRASNTGVSVNDALAMTTNYSKDFDLASVSTITGPDSIIANRTSKTFFVGGKGDEIADYSVNYKKGTTTISGVSINFYGANLRASNTGVSVNDALAMTTNYSKDFDLASVSTITGPDSVIANRTSKTFFVGEKGDEIADYSVNYKKGTTTISGVSINFYGANLRASNTGVSVNDALAMTTNYSKDFDLATVSTITGPDSIIANRTSKTFFVGEKGDEIADYSVNYKKGTTTISGVSINFYGA